MTDRDSENVIHEQMDEAADRATAHFVVFPLRVKNIFAAWVKRWYLSAGYKRLLKIVLEYPKYRRKMRQKHLRQLNWFAQKLQLTGQGRIAQYLREIKQYPILSKTEESRLARKIRVDGDEKAFEHFVCCNLRIVLSLSRKYTNRGVSFLDLITAGNEGLIHAAQKFDERRNVRFFWYAQWWIRRAFQEAISANRSIIPRSYIAKRIQTQISKSIRETGLEPTNEELARKLKTDEQKVEAARGELLPIYSLDEIYEYLDRDIRQEEDVSSVVEHLSFEHDAHLYSPGVDELHISTFRNELVKKALNKLDLRQQEVIKRNFGLGGCNVHNLEKIARMMSLSRERVRQIRNDALKELKHILIKEINKI